MSKFSVRPMGKPIEEYEVVLPGMGRVATVHSFDVNPAGIITRYFIHKIFSATDAEIRSALRDRRVTQ